MDQLRFTAVHEDGQHLVLSSADGTEVLLPIDERLRAALRPRSAALAANAPATPLRPRDVQAMIRAGQSPAEVAEITGWPADRVARFEAPILAEREHVAGMARAAHVRGRDAGGGIPTLESRVRERLTARGVDADNTGWDATRPEGGTWTVLVSFVAGQRQRSAAWRFDPADRTVEAVDDEARWLSEDEQALPGSAAGRALLGGAGVSEEVDLVTSMRERSRSRGRRKKPAGAPDPTDLPGLEDVPEQVLPLEDLPYDPDSMGLPPAAHGAPAAPHDPGGAADPDTTGSDGVGSQTAGSQTAGSQTAGSQTADSDAAAAGTADSDSGRGRRRGRGRAKPPRKSTDNRSRAGAPAAAPAEPAPPEPATTYDVEFDFDSDDFDVDPSPQDATLDDLFGPGVEHVVADDDLEDEFGDESDDDLDDGFEDYEDSVETTVADESAADGTADGTSRDGTDDGTSPDGTADATAGDADGDAPGADASRPDGEVAEAADDEHRTDALAEDVAPGGSEDAGGSTPSSSPAETSNRRRDGRPGVPSWDDIMFGAKDRRGG